MTSDWWLIGIIGSALSSATAGGAASGAAGAAAPAAAGAGGAAAAAPAAATAAPAAAVTTANLAPAAGGSTIATPAAAPAGAGGGGILGGLFGGGGGAGGATIPAPAPGAGVSGPIPYQSAQGPAPGDLTIPELSGTQAGGREWAIPYEYPSGLQPGGGLNPVVPAGGPSFGTQLLQGLRTGLLSQVAGSPYAGGGQSLLSDLGGAVKQRALSALYPETGGRSQQDLEATIRRLMTQQGPSARQLPIANRLPGSPLQNQFYW
jgi:hypothetical protein